MREGRDPNTPVVLWIGSVPYAVNRYVLPTMTPDISLDSKYQVICWANDGCYRNFVRVPKLATSVGQK